MTGVEDATVLAQNVYSVPRSRGNDRMTGVGYGDDE